METNNTDEITTTEQNKIAALTKPFFRKLNLLQQVTLRPIKTGRIQDTLKEPILFLIKNNGYTDVIEGVQPGDFHLNTPEGKKTVVLAPNKLTTLKYGGQYIKAWIAYEDNVLPYPENPLHTSEMYTKTIQKLSMNWRDKDAAIMIQAKTKMWLYIIGGVALVVMILFSFEPIKQIFINDGGQAAATATQTALEEAKRNLTQTVIK